MKSELELYDHQKQSYEVDERRFAADIMERIEKAEQAFVEYREVLKELHQKAGGAEDKRVLLDTTIGAFHNNLSAAFKQAKQEGRNKSDADWPQY